MDGSKATKATKDVLLAFLVGGMFSIVGQVFLVLNVALFGAESTLVGPLTLIYMGLLGLVMYVFGWYQKLMKVGGFGTMMPFCGLAAACAMEFEKARDEKGSTASGVGAATKLVAYVAGTGGLVAVVVAAIMAFAL